MIDPDSVAEIEESLAETVPVDRLFSLLSHPHRRFVLAALARRDEPATVTSLAEEFDEGLDDGEATAATERLERVHVELYHVHVPKLAEADLVAFDPTTDTVAPPEDDPGPAELAPLLPSSEGGPATNVSGSRT